MDLDNSTIELSRGSESTGPCVLRGEYIADHRQRSQATPYWKIDVQGDGGVRRLLHGRAFSLAVGSEMESEAFCARSRVSSSLSSTGTVTLKRTG
jgi:hypothetical protein